MVGGRTPGRRFHTNGDDGNMAGERPVRVADFSGFVFCCDTLHTPPQAGTVFWVLCLLMLMFCDGLCVYTFGRMGRGSVRINNHTIIMF